MRTLIRVAEAQQQQGIDRIARNIAERGSRVVFVSGPSSSGKTTFSHRLGVSLRVCGLRPIPVSLDDYYRDRDEVPLSEDGKPDLECPEAIDIPLFSEHLLRLLEVQVYLGLAPVAVPVGFVGLRDPREVDRDSGVPEGTVVHIGKPGNVGTQRVPERVVVQPGHGPEAWRRVEILR